MENKLEPSNQDSGLKKSLFDDLNREELIIKCKGLLAIAQKAKLAKTELQNDLDNHKILLEKCVNEKKTSLENVHTLQELVDSLTEQKLNYITEVDSAQSKIKALSSKCNKHEEDINKYKADLILRESHIAELTQKLSDIDSEVISLKRQNNRFLEENEQLINQLSEIEARTTEFNNIGLQQREQLRILEENVQTDSKSVVEELNNKIKELENKLQSAQENEQKVIDFESKLEEVNQLYESEKVKKERLNIKLKSYKDKIMKCAACINQLKNSRYILTKTVKDYSENIPKWQNDIIKASKVLDDQINELSNENTSLKEKVQSLEIQLNKLLTSQMNVHSEIEKSKNDSNNEIVIKKSEISDLQEQIHGNLSDNIKLNDELTELKQKYQQVNELQLPAQINENMLLKDQLDNQLQKFKDLSLKNNELLTTVKNLEVKNQNIEAMIQNKTDNDTTENLILQIKSLESEKSTLVKEKHNARDSVVELENKNKILTDQIAKLRLETKTIKNQMETMSQEKLLNETNYKKEKDSEINILKCKVKSLQEQNDMLKKEHDNMQDLNGLLKEEVETLKLSLEQPKDDNLSDLNVSLQADVVKLETKLSAYKQENASLLAEVKESRNKVKEFDMMVAEYEDAKSKLAGYKTENTELLNEMKEINQVLKERGESISKLEKALTEMERLVETLEKDRDVVKQEKDDLLKKVELLECDLKNAKQETNKSSILTDQIIVEKENALKLLIEKDTLLANMRDEIEKLKQHNSSSAELPNEDNMSTSTISKAEEHTRMKDLDETFEEKYTKLRIFALKLKKKLNETITQLQNTEQDKAKLEKMLAENGAVNNRHIPIASNEKVEAETEDKSACSIAMLQAKVMSLTTDVQNSQLIVEELEKTKAELDSKNQQLTAEIEAHKVTKDNLEKARRDVKKKDVLSLEMEDYERSMKELTTKMEEKKKKMVQMESTIDTQEGTITAMKTQIKLLEEQIKTEESQSRLIKEELQHTVEEGKEKDNVILVKNGIISKLEQDLEDEKRKNEETDLEMTSLLGEKEKIIMSLGEDKAELNNRLKRLEFKCGELNESLKIVNIELADLKTEHTSYKVRAQAVLRQNQIIDHSQEEQLKEEAAALKAQIENLTVKLASVQEQFSEQTAELENTRRRGAEASAEATRAQQRTARLHTDLTRLSQQMESERTQHKLQVSTLTQCYKSQISELESKLQKETELLKKQLAVAQETIQSGKMGEAALQTNSYMLPVIPKDEGSDGEMDINVSMIPREEGEGSEAAPSPPPSKSYITSGGSGRSPVPLERLLEEGVPDDEALDASSLALTTDQEIADLKRRLQAQQQRVKHVTVLLSESERECARMAQLSELLKAELRRVRGAAHQPHNTEYMKNVTLKFLTLPPGDERCRLVPVIQKILTLTSDETHKIQAIAKGLDPNPSKGWGSYLPWPGGK